MTDRSSPFAAGPVHPDSAATAQVRLNTQRPWAVPFSRSRDGHPDICLERLARMASVDGQWWEECDRQMRRRARVWSYWLFGLLGAGIGLAIAAAGVAYQTLG